MTIQYNSNYNETIPFSDTCAQINCDADIEQIYLVPGVDTDQYQALFSYIDTANVFVTVNASPVVPVAGTVTDQQYTEFRPCKRYVKGGDVLHFITPDTTAYIGVSLRKLQG